MSRTKKKKGNTTKGPKPGMSAYFRNMFKRNKSLDRTKLIQRFVKRWGAAKLLTVVNYIGYAKADNQYNPLPYLLTEKVNKRGRTILTRGKA